MKRVNLIVLLLSLVCIITYSQPVYSDAEKPQTQPSGVDINKLIEKYLNDIEFYATDYDEEEFDYEIVENNFYKAKWELIKLGKKVVIPLINKLKTIKVDNWGLLDSENDPTEQDYIFAEALPEILGKIGKPAYPFVKEMLQDKDIFNRKHAINILYHNRQLPLSMLDPILQGASLDYNSYFAKKYDDDEFMSEDDYFDELYGELYIYDMEFACKRVTDAKPHHFIKALNDIDPYVRIAAMFYLSTYTEISYNKLDEKTHDAVRKAAKDKTPYVRYLALDCLCNVHDVKDIPLFISALEDNDPNVSEQAYYAVQSFDKSLIVDDMFKLIDSKNQDAKWFAISYFGKTSMSKVVQKLIPELDVYGFSDVSSKAILNCADKTHVNQMLELIDSQSTNVIKTAIEVLTKLDVDSIHDQVLQSITSEVVDLRVACVKWLAKFGTIEDIDILLKTIKDESENVRAESVIALTNINNDKIHQILIDAMKDESLLVKKNVCIAAAKLNSKKFTPEINSLILSNDWDINIDKDLIHTAIDALVKIENLNSLPTLIKKFAVRRSEYKSYILTKVNELHSDSKIEKTKVLDAYYSLLKISVASLMPDHTNTILEQLKSNKDKKFIAALNDSLNLAFSDNIMPVLQKLYEFADKSSIQPILRFIEKGEYYYNHELHPQLTKTLIKICDESHVPELLKILKSGDSHYEFVLMNAVCALGGKKHINTISELLESEDSELKCAAIMGYTILADDPYPLLLKRFKLDNDPKAKIDIATFFVKNEKDESKEFENYIFNQLSDSEYNYDAVNALQKLKLKSANAHLTKYLKYQKPDFVHEIVKTLAYEGNTNAIPALSDMLLNYHVGYIRESIAFALRVIGDKSAVSVLIESMKNDIDYEVRGSAARVLGELGDVSAIPALIEALSDTEEQLIFMCGCPGCCETHSVQEFAIIALGKLGDESVINQLRKVAEENESEYIQKLVNEAINSIESKAKPE